ncbi:hypothetical protein [Nonomuraea sp. NPDC002799]
MAFLGVILMIQGFGGLIARHIFDRDFGVLHNWLDGGPLTAVNIAAGLAGLALTVLSGRKKETE